MMTQAKTEAPLTLLGALVAALPELEAAKKTTENPGFKKDGKALKYADLGAVIDAIRPIAAHGLWFRQVSHEAEHGASVETIYIHASGELSAGHVFVPADKNNAQGFGSAQTYARRYGLQLAFGLATEDDDGNAATAAQRKPAPTITDEQRTELMTLFDHLNVPVAEFLAIGKIKDLRELGAERFEGAKSWINNRAIELRGQKDAA